MKITLKHYDVKYTIETEHDDFDMEHMINDIIRPLLLVMGFHPNTIDEYLGRE